MKDLTAIIKTFLRDDYFFNCYDSLKGHYPDIKVLVADSGEDTEEKTSFIKKNKIKYYKLPYDSGICVGRNFLVKKVKTKYVLIGDDDFQYDNGSKLQEMINFLEANPEYDLIGGRIFENNQVRNYQGNMEIVGRTLKYTKLELDNFKICPTSQIKYKPCDLTFNFFIARTEALKSTLWEEKIKVRYEHSTFFLDFKEKGYKVVFTPDSIVTHKPIIEKRYNIQEYYKYRARVEDKQIFYDRFNIDRVIDFNGHKDYGECKYSDITFCIKTFERKPALERLLFSIANYYPQAKILIADDSNRFDVPYYKDLWQRLDKEGLINKPVAYNLGYDMGLSYGRNFLVDKATTKYCLILDDDYEFTDKTDILKLQTILDNDEEIGIAGGLIMTEGVNELHFEHNFELIDRVLYHRPDESELKKIGDVKYITPDCIPNFFLMRKELGVKWDDKIKIGGEHSVKGDTPIIILNNKSNIEYKCITIDTLLPDSARKILEKGNKREISLSNQNIFCWTEVGWKKIKKIIAHKCNEKMVKIRTKSGYVECTEHHSLVINGNEVTPNSLNIGDKIELHKYPELINEIDVDKDWAWFMGYFLAEGCCSVGRTLKISITNKNIGELERSIKILNKFNIEAKILNTKERKDGCKFLSVVKPKKYLEIFNEFYDKDKRKKIPDSVFKWNKKSRKEFFKGFINGDGDHAKSKYLGFSQKNLVTISGLLWLISDIYPNYSIREKKNKHGKWFNIAILKAKDGRFSKDRNLIINKEYYDYDGLVYDIEIDDEKHTFLGGIGNINLHNTSFMFSLKGKWKVAYCRDVSINHIHLRDQEYKAMRKREEFLIYMMKNNGFDKIVYLNGGGYEIKNGELIKF